MQGAGKVSPGTFPYLGTFQKGLATEVRTTSVGHQHIRTEDCDSAMAGFLEIYLEIYKFFFCGSLKAIPFFSKGSPLP